MNAKNFLRTAVGLLLLSAMTPAAGGSEPDGVTLPPKEQFHLFLLAGQSNMAGRGKVADEDRRPHARVLMLTKEGRWAPAVDPLHFDKPRVVGVGVGRTFGILYAQSHPRVTVGLIPCAAGGSPIAAWEPGGYHPQTKSHPYDDALRRGRNALRSGVLKGILWHQGESDAKPGQAEVYEKKLHAMVARFRKELAAPGVPFLAGQLGQFAERPWNDAKRRVDAAHRSLAGSVPHSAFVSSDGLTHKGDQVHFDAKSYRELGKRYAATYKKLAAEKQDAEKQDAKPR